MKISATSVHIFCVWMLAAAFGQQQMQQQQQQQGQQEQQNQQGQVQTQQGQGHEQGHHHDHRMKVGDNFLQNQDVVQNKAHIQEHLEGVVDKLPEEMSPAELKFHYFQTHDFDTDMRLDGLELMHTIREANANQIPQDQLIMWVDKILDADDKNKDGYIDFPEFMKSQQTR